MARIDEIGILFDLDGVLLDTEGAYSHLWTDIDGCYPTGVPDFAAVIKGSNLDNILNTYFSPEVHADVVRRLDEYQATMQYMFFDGTLEWLDALADAGLPMCVVTSSDERKMNAVYAQHPTFKQRFAAVVTGDMVSNPKPDPECFLLGAALLHKLPENCVVFEDSVNGLKAARSAGTAVIGLSTTCPQEIVKPLCDKCVASLAELTVNDIVELLSGHEL